ncbi:MAG: DNA polymerase [Candidatus Sericytochromatia bacterium]|nr:DNA polymerase [Candidatus Sericytochromatia bacterium]
MAAPEEPGWRVVEDPEGLAEVAASLAPQEACGVVVAPGAPSPLEGRPRLLALATPDMTWLLDLQPLSDLGPLAAVLAAPRPIKVCHHAKPALRWLGAGGLRVGGLFDTLLASQLLHEDERHELPDLTWRWLGVAVERGALALPPAGPLADAQLGRAAREARLLLELRRVLRPRLLDAGLARVAMLEFGVVPAVAAMEQAGVLLDVAAWRALLRRVEAERDALEARLLALLAGTRAQLALLPEVAPPLNLSSSQQVRAALAHLGVAVPDTSEASLQAVRDAHPVVPLLLAHRHAQKAVSSYGEGMLAHVHPRTGRLHATFTQLQTSTGRFSCSQPNLQNIPADAAHRACFVAPPGHRLVVADYSQMELRILAELSGDAAFRRAFEQGLDLHRMTASEMFWVPYNEVKPAQRSAAKGINFGLVYGRGAASLAGELGVSVERARELIARYFETYRGVEAWLRTTARTAIEARELRSLAGRRARYAFDAQDRAAVAAVERAGKNFPIQATNSDILKQAMAWLPARLAPLGARLVNCIHDELVVEAPIDRAEAAAAALRATMQEAGGAFLQTTPVEVDVKVAASWEK